MIISQIMNTKKQAPGSIFNCLTPVFYYLSSYLIIQLSSHLVAV